VQIHQRPRAVKVMNLLAACSLPNADLSPGKLQHFFGCGVESNPGGVVGVELYGDVALLRSLAVRDDVRGKGCGRRLVQEVELYAGRSGVKRLYLLTTTAERFFASLGYQTVSRDSAPAAIRGTTEFSSLCSTSAALMAKDL
jgi:amino-acid N-acetyltransferase